jgi:hypothetical protein
MTNTIITTSEIKNGQFRDLDNIWHKTKINKAKTMSNRNPSKNQKTKKPRSGTHALSKGKP